MDLIYTNENRVDQGVLSAYAFDLSFGADADENDFEMIIGKSEADLKAKSVIYIEGTEYGGMIDAMKSSTNDESITYKGRTWHGILNSKVIQPDSGKNYLVVSGDANAVLSMLISRLGLSDLFSAVETSSGVSISKYQFPRYCKGYDGIRAMLAKNGAKLKIAWKDRAVYLSAEPIVDYTASPVDGDVAPMTVERHETKVNHLICLGRGELSEREVIHLYVDQFGRIGDIQFFTGLEEVVEIYENTDAESTEDLRNGGITRLEKLRDNDKAEMDLTESENPTYDIGDIVGSKDVQSGISISAAVSQKIVRINNGVISTEYKTGG